MIKVKAIKESQQNVQPIGSQGTSLSAGQWQRLALASALYGNPFIVITDEPNSNLDGEGETALTEAIERIGARGGIVIINAHRPRVALDIVAIVQKGRMAAFKQDVMTPGLQPSTKPGPEAFRIQIRRPA